MILSIKLERLLHFTISLPNILFGFQDMTQGTVFTFCLLSLLQSVPVPQFFVFHSLFWRVQVSYFVQCPIVQKLGLSNVFPILWLRLQVGRRIPQRWSALLIISHQGHIMSTWWLLVMFTLVTWWKRYLLSFSTVNDCFSLGNDKYIDEKIWNYANMIFPLKVLPTDCSIHRWTCWKQLLLRCSNGNFVFSLSLYIY